MHFKEMPTEAPVGLVTADFVLRPIAVADAAMDYAAVMESRDFLHAWEQSSWPEDDFTVDANRKDMELLEQRHNAREAFTYTVTNPDGTECLGCVYLMPPDARSFTRARIEPVSDRSWEEYATTIYFWVRKSQLPHALDRTLLATLRTCMAQDWPFGRWLFVTNEQFGQQVALFEDAGLQLRFTIAEPDKLGRYLAFE